MDELSLFTGAGGGILGSKILGWRTLGYVEFNDYCQRVIAQRIKDGIYDKAPIFGDVRTFVSEGYARSYHGMVDVVSGGFPCQPFSVAGKRAGSDDSRDMWPATMGVIKAVKPRIVFLENVPGLLSASMDDSAGRSVYYFGTILRDLAESGYDVKWTVLGADDVGAPHHRKRLWILGVHADSKRDGPLTTKIEGVDTEQSQGVDQSEAMADTKRQRGRCWYSGWQNAAHARQLGISEGEYAGGVASWNIEPVLGRVAHGVVNRANRLRAIGNGQVPLTMATAYAILSEGFAGRV